jgi:hypothetical protein
VADGAERKPSRVSWRDRGPPRLIDQPVVLRTPVIIADSTQGERCVKDRRIPARSRRGWLVKVLLIAVCLGIGLPARQGAAQDATALLEASAEAMAAVESFHFVITTIDGKVVLADRIELQRVEGDYQRPDRLRAKASAKVVFMPVGIDLLVIDGQIWYSDPIRGGNLKRLELENPQLQEILVDFDPGAVLLSAVGYVTDPVIVGTEEIDGMPTTLIEGTVDLAPIAAKYPDVDINRLPLPVRVWIDDADLVVRLQLVGQVLLSEPEGIIHQLDLSAFNEPVFIELPEG